MPHRSRNAPGGFVHHVSNRGVGRQTLFHKEQAYAAFERVLAEAHQRVPPSNRFASPLQRPRMRMPRGPRNAPGGFVYHVINRGVGRQTLFHKEEDYAAFERVLAEACQRVWPSNRFASPLHCPPLHCPKTH